MATIPPSLPISPQPSDSSWVKATPEAVTKGMDQKTYDAAKGKISPQESEHTKPANDYKSTPLPNSEDIDALMTELERLAKDDLPPEEQSQQPIGLPEETSQSPVSDVASKLRELDELAEQLGKPIGLPKETSQSPVSDVDPKLEKLDKQAEQMHQEEKKPSISSEEFKKTIKRIFSRNRTAFRWNLRYRSYEHSL